ncbi:MAG: hypothetical protein VYB45_04500 [Pseudomonadota bacterium]|jgi:hypothetical protein|nr:hypothetical protein [Pseudomonadota bacterium]|tara:strand:+ start:17 stop:163 length:147 start_codon:yes stop_codon:yes gene_type:complete
MIIDMHTHFAQVEMAAALRQRSEPPGIEGSFGAFDEDGFEMRSRERAD